MKQTKIKQLLAVMGTLAFSSLISPSFAQTDWSLSGNTPAGTDFLGSTNNQDLIIKTNNAEAFRFKANGDLDWPSGHVFKIGGTSFLYAYSTSSNMAIGMSAGINHTTGVNNLCIGANSGYSNTSGASNIMVGLNAGASNTTGYYNTYIGSYSAWRNIDGYANTFVGALSGRDHYTGYSNTFIGYAAGFHDSIGIANVFVGTDAGLNNYTGYSNTFLGEDAGTNNTSGYKNMCLGNYANLSSSGLINATAIGYGAVVSANYSMLFGDASITRWGFGVNAASGHAIEVGDDGTNGNGAYLTSGGVWTNASDVNKKENIKALNSAEILKKIDALSITSWSYKGEKGINHIGPMAQDFYRLFQVGNDDKSISTIDPAGVALVGIKELHKEQQNQQAELTNLKQDNELLKQNNETLKQQLLLIQQQLNELTGKTTSSSNEPKSILYQNSPNPFSESTVIKYNVVNLNQSAKINVYSVNNSQLVQSFQISEKGAGQFTLSAQTLQPGNYTYELIVDGIRTDAKKLIIIK